MTKIVIEICAADDWEAMRVLDTLHTAMRSDARLDPYMVNDAGYDVGGVEGNGVVTVSRAPDMPLPGWNCEEKTQEGGEA